MEPITLIDASLVRNFRLPVKDDSCLTSSPEKLHDKEFFAIFMLTVVLPRIAKLGIHSPENGKNVVLIVDDRNTFTERYDPAFFGLLCHSSVVMDVIDQHDNIADAALNITARNGNNACFMIFNSSCHNVEEIVNTVKPLAFSFTLNVSKCPDQFDHFFAIQYAIPHAKFLRMFVVQEQDGTFARSRLDWHKMINLMVDVSKHFDHDKWIASIVNIFEFITTGMRTEAFQLKKLLTS